MTWTRCAPSAGSGSRWAWPRTGGRPRHTWALAAVALALAVASGCHSPSEPSGPDSLSLSKITPADGTMVAPGSSVSVTASVKYTLSDADQGLIYLNSTDQNGNLLGHQPSVLVGRGRGSETLSDHFSVPATGVTQVTVTIVLTPAELISFGGGPEVQALYPVGP